ncbi:MAG: flagellar hook-associated protein FlgL [Pseudomonadales bacterium]|nr:flagellar hook-associated protein FlgL [Pseudomonadales bacterium]
MKISTAQLYNLGIQAITSQQQKLAETQAQLSSGKRINLPSDDPTGMAKLLDITAGIDRLDQYASNADFATNSLAQEETVLAQVNTGLLRVRELILQANNATNSASDRTSIAQEIEQRLQEITALANTTDAAGNYIFAGTRTDTVPFSVVNGQVVYGGDQGQRSVKIGNNTTVRLGDSGDASFLRIRNGDGNITVAANGANTGEAVFGSYSASAPVTESYSINFVAGANPGELMYEVRDSGSALIVAGNYSEGDSVSFQDITVQFSGLPAAGDSFDVSPSQYQSVFTTIENVLSALEGSAGQPAAAIHNSLGRGIADIDQALEHVNTLRAGVGSRLNLLESTDNANQDLKLHLETIRSETGDLDFVEAISRFNQQLVSLEAAQAAFAKATELSLFRYL